MLHFLFTYTLLVLAIVGTLSADGEGAGIFISSASRWWEDKTVTGWVGGDSVEARVNGSISWPWGEFGVCKFSAEYLTQRICHEILGDEHKWIWQVGAGAAYLYPCQLWRAEYMEFGGYCSSASNHKLERTTCFLSSAVEQERIIATLFRRLTGANAFGVSGGFIWNLGGCSSIATILNYDTIDYDTLFMPLGTKDGFGVTLRWSQRLLEMASLHIEGTLRRPYSHIRGSLRWELAVDDESWMVGLFGSYVKDRFGAPNHSIVGIEVDHWFGGHTIAEEWNFLPAYWAPYVLTIPDGKICAAGLRVESD